MLKQPGNPTDNTPVTAISTPPPLPVPAFSEENLRQIADARAGMRKIRRAISMATFDAWTVCIFGAITVVCSIGSMPGLLLGMGMSIVAIVEFRTIARLRRLEPDSVRVLGINQLVLGSLLILYAASRIYAQMTGPGDYAALAGSDPSLSEALQPVEGLVRMVTLAVYGGVIAIAVLGQGSMALYYFTRRKYVQAYVRQTPDWIIRMQRVGISI